MDIKDIILCIIIIVIIYILFFKKNNIEHIENIENINTLIRNAINEQYNMDIEAIRNLGAISKSLLSGTNYHNTSPPNPGTLTIPGDIVIEGNIKVKGDTNLEGNTKIDGNTNIKNGKHLYFNGNTSDKKSDLFFNNDINGLEISQKECDNLRLQQNNNGFDLKSDNIQTISGDPLKIVNNLQVDGHAEIGSAYIGNSRNHGLSCAEFSNKNKTGDTGYTLLAQEDGTTILNTSHDNQPIHMRRLNSATNASIAYHIHRILTRFNYKIIDGKKNDNIDASSVIHGKLTSKLMEAGDILYTKGYSHNQRNHLGSVVMYPNKKENGWWFNVVDFCHQHRNNWNLYGYNNKELKWKHLQWDGYEDMSDLHTT